MRLKRYGDPLGGGPSRRFDSESRFLASVVRDESGCLLWTAATQPNGYGVMTREGGGMMRAHRYAWERMHGAIPDGVWIDHACHNRACVEVSHLRLADALTNGANRSGENSNNALGVRNVHRHKNGFRVRVMKNRTTHDGGVFKDIDSASAAAEELRRELFGAFAGRGGAR